MSTQCPKCQYYFDEDKILTHLAKYHKLGMVQAKKILKEIKEE